MYAPMPETETDQAYIQRLPKILNNISEVFSYDSSTFTNEISKKNCARLAFHRDFNVLDSYTIEASCFGF
jgi:hypothetical protein